MINGCGPALTVPMGGMKLSVLNSMSGFHLVTTPPTVQSFPVRLRPPGTMTSADFSRQALLRDSECFIATFTSVRPPRVLTRSFPLIPAPFTAGVPCSYWTLVCQAASSTLHSLSGQLLQASGLPPASFRPHLTMTPLPLAAPFPLPGGSGTFTR